MHADTRSRLKGSKAQRNPYLKFQILQAELSQQRMPRRRSPFTYKSALKVLFPLLPILPPFTTPFPLHIYQTYKTQAFNFTKIPVRTRPIFRLHHGPNPQPRLRPPSRRQHQNPQEEGRQIQQAGPPSQEVFPGQNE